MLSMHSEEDSPCNNNSNDNNNTGEEFVQDEFNGGS